MAIFTKYIRLGLTATILERIRAEAKQRKISLNELVRRALERYLNEESQRRRILGVYADAPLHLVNSPLVHWSPTEEQFAHQVIQRHFDEDR
jgi:hypothetical protein